MRDLEHIYDEIDADHSNQALMWFQGLTEAIDSLEQHPARGATLPESSSLRHLLYGKKPHVYRIIYNIDERNRAVNVLHIRHGAQDVFRPDEV